MKRLAVSAALALAVAACFATTSPTPKAAYTPKSWVINLGAGFPQSSDASDAGFDVAWLFGADYNLGYLGEDNRGSTYVGFKGYYSRGDGDERAWAYGVHYGVQFALGQNSDSMPLSAKIEAGYYYLKVEDGFNDHKWGLGGSASLVWHPSTQTWRLEAGYFWLPSMNDFDTNGWFVAFGFPVG